MILEEWIYQKKNGGIINWLSNGVTWEYLRANYNVSASKSLDENVASCKDIRFIGLEFELENVRVQNPRTMIAKMEQEKYGADFHEYWIVTNDGSLRNNGMEIISRRGLSIQNLSTALQSLENAFKFYFQSGIQISSRCSLHVHYNVWDYSVEELRSLILVYTMVESAMYAISGNRKNNIFCVPNSKMSRSYWSHLFTSLHNKKNRSKRVEWEVLVSPYQKYAGLNLRPIHEYGTVEFRQHAGTMDLNEVKEWVQIINEVCETSRIHTWKEWLDIAKEAWDKNQEKDLIEFISPSLFTKLSKTVTDFKTVSEKDIKYALWASTDDSLIPELSDVEDAKDSKKVPFVDWNAQGDFLDWSMPDPEAPATFTITTS